MVDAIQDRLIDSSYEATQKASCDDANVEAVEFGIERDIIKERAQNKKREWCHDEKLDGVVKKFAQSKGLASDDKEIQVFLKDLGSDKEEQYELPEFVADLKERGVQLKARIVVVSWGVSIWRLKRKEAQVVDGVLRLLRKQMIDSSSADEVRSNVGETILDAIRPNRNDDNNPSNGELYKIGYDNPLVKGVFVKELVLYEPGLRKAIQY